MVSTDPLMMINGVLTFLGELSQFFDLSNLLLSLGRFESSDGVFEKLGVGRITTVVWNTIVVLVGWVRRVAVNLFYNVHYLASK